MKALQQEYTIWLNTMGFSKSLVYDYTFRIKEFLQWLQNNNITNITQLKTKHIYTYINYLETRPNKRREGGLSASHLNHNFMAIDKFLEYLHTVGLETAPTPLNYRILQNKQERINNIKPFTQEEIKELQANIKNTYPNFPYLQREKKHEQLKLIFVLNYASGLRRTESYKLTIQDIDFYNKTIFIKQGKNYKDRIIPMNKNVYKALEHYIYNFRNLQRVKHNRLFIHTTGTLSQSLKELQRITNMPTIQTKKLNFHILRHSIATQLLQNGMNIENISKFLGHSSLDSTQIYTHIVNN